MGDFLPSERALALYLFKTARRLGIYPSDNFSKRFFYIAKRVYRDIERKKLDFIKNNGYICPISGLKEGTIKAELEFRGFIPIEQYPRKLHERYGYFMTNREICGQIYIYPQKFADSVGTLKIGIPYYSEYMGKIGLEGITKYHFGNTPL